MRKLFLLIIVSIVLVSCQKDFDPIEEQPEYSGKNLTEATIDPGFNWKTTKDVTVQISGFSQKVIDLVSENGGSYYKAFVDNSGEHTAKINVPAHINEVTLKVSGQVVETIGIANNKIMYSLNN